MKIKAFAVLDTNVLISSLISNGFPRNVMKLAEHKNVIPIFDKRILNEYYDVLTRDKFNFSSQNIYDILYFIISNGIMIDDVKKAKEEFIDRDDIPFFEVKESSEEFDTYLVTGNIKHFPQSSSTVTPKEFINILEKLDHYLQADFDFEKNIRELINMQISTSKYKSGEDIINKIFDQKSHSIKNTYFNISEENQ